VSEQQFDDPGGTFNRRSFMRKLAIGGFVLPVVGTFGLDSLAQAGGYSSQCYPNQTYYANQFRGDPYSHSYPNQISPDRPDYPHFADK